jgi:hypothetical protein
VTKSEIIESTLKAMGCKWELLPPDGQERDDNDSADRYNLIVIQELFERLPEVELRTCADFAHLGVECCDTCHYFYPHYDMYVEDLSDGGKAWICCAVSRALRGEKNGGGNEEIDLEEALGGGVRQKSDDETDFE